VNTFEKFLKNLQQGSQNDVPPQSFMSLPMKGNAGIGGIKRSFQYQVDMHIKSMNSSGLLSNNIQPPPGIIGKSP